MVRCCSGYTCGLIYNATSFIISIYFGASNVLTKKSVFYSPPQFQSCVCVCVCDACRLSWFITNKSIRHILFNSQKCIIVPKLIFYDAVGFFLFKRIDPIRKLKYTKRHPAPMPMDLTTDNLRNRSYFSFYRNVYVFQFRVIAVWSKCSSRTKWILSMKLQRSFFLSAISFYSRKFSYRKQLSHLW